MVVYENISQYVIQMHNETVSECITKTILSGNNIPAYLCSPIVEKIINISAIIICVIILAIIIYFAWKQEQKEKEKEQNVTNEVKQNVNDQIKG